MSVRDGVQYILWFTFYLPHHTHPCKSEVSWPITSLCLLFNVHFADKSQLGQTYWVYACDSTCCRKTEFWVTEVRSLNISKYGQKGRFSDFMYFVLLVFNSTNRSLQDFM